MPKQNRRIVAAIKAAKAAERQQRHAAEMAKHEERRLAIERYEDLYWQWADPGMIGPEPIHPDSPRLAAKRKRIAAERTAQLAA